MQLKQIVFVPPALAIAAQHLNAFEQEGLDLKNTFTRSSYQQRDGLLDRRGGDRKRQRIRVERARR